MKKYLVFTALAATVFAFGATEEEKENTVTTQEDVGETEQQSSDMVLRADDEKDDKESADQQMRIAMSDVDSETDKTAENAETEKTA